MGETDHLKQDKLAEDILWGIPVVGQLGGGVLREPQEVEQLAAAAVFVWLLIGVVPAEWQD